MTALRWCMGAMFLASAVCPGPGVAQTRDPRILGLQGASNFRDLGGYETANGRHVRRGVIFRSNALSSLTAADEARVDELHIVSEIDLRTVQERATDPDRWLRKPAYIYESSKPSINPIIGPMLASVKDRPTARAWLQGFYARMPDAYRDEYTILFHRLASGEVPLLIHCTAGKDRTGVASAILLSALGVSRQTVVADYTLTETLLPPPPNSPATGKRSPATAVLTGLPADARLELWRSDDSFILASLRSIDQEYGSIDGYLKAGLGMSETDIGRLKKRLTD